MSAELAPYAIDPFGPSANPGAYVACEASERARATLERALDQGRVAAVVGPPGYGKTLLLHLLGGREQERARVAYVPFCTLEEDEFYAFVLSALGAVREGPAPRDALLALARELAPRGGVVILVDDASSMSDERAASLAQLRDESLGALRIALAAVEGPDALRVCRAFGDSIDVAHLADGMSEREVRRYVETRLAYGGARPEVVAAFDDETIRKMHRASKGVPRRVNQEAESVVRRASPGALPRLWELAGFDEAPDAPVQSAALRVLEAARGNAPAASPPVARESQAGAREANEPEAPSNFELHFEAQAEPETRFAPEIRNDPETRIAPETPVAPEMRSAPAPPAARETRAGSAPPAARETRAGSAPPAARETRAGSAPPAAPETRAEREMRTALEAPAEPERTRVEPPLRAEPERTRVAPPVRAEPEAPREVAAKPPPAPAVAPKPRVSAPAPKAPQADRPIAASATPPDTPVHEPPVKGPPRVPSHAAASEAPVEEDRGGILLPEAYDEIAAAAAAEASGEYRQVRGRSVDLATGLPEGSEPAPPAPEPSAERRQVDLLRQRAREKTPVRPAKQARAQLPVRMIGLVGFALGVGVAFYWMTELRPPTEALPLPDPPLAAVPAEPPAAPAPAPRAAAPAPVKPARPAVKPAPAPTVVVAPARPAATPAQPPPAPSATAAAAASIPVSINATPWAVIEVDGRELGETPLAGIPLSPGLHVFRARMPDGSIRERAVEIAVGQSTVVFH